MHSQLGRDEPAEELVIFADDGMAVPSPDAFVGVGSDAEVGPMNMGVRHAMDTVCGSELCQQLRVGRCRVEIDNPGHCVRTGGGVVEMNLEPGRRDDAVSVGVGNPDRRQVRRAEDLERSGNGRRASSARCPPPAFDHDHRRRERRAGNSNDCRRVVETRIRGHRDDRSPRRPYDGSIDRRERPLDQRAFVASRYRNDDGFDVHAHG